MRSARKSAQWNQYVTLLDAGSIPPGSILNQRLRRVPCLAYRPEPCSTVPTWAF